MGMGLEIQTTFLRTTYYAFSSWKNSITKAYYHALVPGTMLRVCGLWRLIAQSDAKFRTVS
jgi:hypothetical protein